MAMGRSRGGLTRDFLLLNPAVEVAHPQEIFYTHYERQREMLNLGLAALAAYLKKNGLSFEILDANIEGLSADETFRRISPSGYRCLGISLNVYNSAAAARLVKKLRRAGFTGHVAVGGAFASLYPEYLLRTYPDFDSVVYGDGEGAVRDLAMLSRKGRDWRGARGIFYRGASGRLVRTGHCGLTEDLDALPRPLRYSGAAAVQQVELARGCYGSCSFCSLRRFYGMSGNFSVRRRSLRSVFEELAPLYAAGCRDFEFQADNFFPSPEGADGFLDEFEGEVLRRRLSMRFNISCRPDDITAKRLSRLKRCGLSGVFIGVESVDPGELARFNKKLSVGGIVNAVNLLLASRLNFGCGYIFFSPWSDFSSLVRSANFMMKVGLSRFPYGAYRMKAHPGTGVHEAIAREGLARRPPRSLLRNPEGLYHSYAFKDPRVGIIWEAADALYRGVYGYIMRDAFSSYARSGELTRAKNVSDLNVLRYVGGLIEAAPASESALRSLAASRFSFHLDLAVEEVRRDLVAMGGKPVAPGRAEL